MQVNKKKLFEKFSRSNETTKMVVSGTGLGLFVGKNFIAAHGGHIHIESDGPGKGSRFIVELPFSNPKIKAGTSDQASFEGLGK
ncbi:MAG: sensor histidine kinase [Minisyncoccota bacterium]